MNKRMNISGNIDLSVIIPVYNVENYLPVCIDSVIHQAGLRLEIILINDGSTDCSGVIADQYTQKDSRIKVIHQKNRGVSATRNAGLNSTGRIYCFRG
jgi:glycosyltransferase involved in cell wall biosynthesis